ncbi:hypothetical protein DI424_00325 [Salmonella enterica subsp. enterica serovar Oakland]|nr:hypothetical protein [Salmonella enterica subsp. enterica serovar Oakland]EEM2750568.1 hypothetical protein [Salmonella enterica]EIT1872009.1 hypothetical protein [Salmonella enterica]HBD1866295.1 hypothetical protein [Salmonella enterica]HBL9985563.1 hypothetical protein [Salmonella enterica subsp. enterica serovar Fomeco]
MFGLALIGFASGVDAASRFWPGRVVATGMLTGNLFTMFVLPTVCVWLARLRQHIRAKFSFISSTRRRPRLWLLSWSTFSP